MRRYLAPMREQVQRLSAQIDGIRRRVDAEDWATVQSETTAVTYQRRGWLRQLRDRMDSFERVLPSDADRQQFSDDFHDIRVPVGTLVATIEALEEEVAEVDRAARQHLMGLRKALDHLFRRFEWSTFGKLDGSPDLETVELARIDLANEMVEVRGGDMFLGQPRARHPSAKVLEEARDACNLIEPGSLPEFVRRGTSWNMCDGAPCYTYVFQPA